MNTHASLPPVYDPRQVEPQIHQFWKSKGYFRARPDDRGPDRRFVIVIPPPNVTGALHLGHAINNTLQDILIRRRRMQGYNTLWLPGTDHAGIATQAVVEKRIKEEEGKDRFALGRDGLVQRIWDWKEQYEARILSQLQRMGCSCDWSRTRFTLDEGLTKAVRRQFFRFFKDRLIFRGKRLVNWDTQLQTAVSDDEVYHESVKGHFWHFKYPFIDAQPGEPAHVHIATTRPETMLADTAVAVHPDPAGILDQREAELRDRLAGASAKEKPDIRKQLDHIAERRATHLPLLIKLAEMARSGRHITLPLVDRRIPLIVDEWAKPELGSGCVKITPAHDPNDYEVGLRHGLPMINILTPDGRVNAAGGKYEGLAFPAARKAVVADLEALDLVEKVEDHEVEVGHSDRSKTPIEPYLSDQWFVRMGELAGPAIDAVTQGRVRFTPQRYAKSYLDWLGERRDWCISRQLWWGHRIPIWYCSTCTEGDLKTAFGKRDDVAWIRDAEAERWIICSRDEDLGDRLGDHALEQDPDVLDTWFSSALWPYGTLGWPDETEDLKYYYPGSVLVTSRDIITNWVVRMVLTGLYHLGDAPFRDVYIHAKILDGRGETMSKSKGNGVDPLDIIDVSGADALRYTLADMATETQDVRMPVEYQCPHCDHLTEQSQVVPKGKQPSDIKKVRCKNCKQEFATQWADAAAKAQLKCAKETSDKFEIGRNFCNKLWNAARFALMNLEGIECRPIDLKSLPPEDRWILAQLSAAVRRWNEDLEVYQFSSAVKGLREFFWDSLCDWYIELTKGRLNGGHEADHAKQVLGFCMDQALRLLHPLLPHITERLWASLNEIAPRRGLPGLAMPEMAEGLAIAEFPPREGWPKLDDPQILAAFAALQEATRAIREIRSRYGVPPRDKVTVTIKAPEHEAETLRHEAEIIRRLAGVGDLHIRPDARRPVNSATVLSAHMHIMVHDITDDDAERERLTKELGALEGVIENKQNKLSGAAFVDRAPAEVVEAERQRLEEAMTKREVLRASLAMLDE